VYINRLYDHLEGVVDITGAICISIQLLYSIPHENFEYSFKKKRSFSSISCWSVNIVVFIHGFTIISTKGFSSSIPPAMEI